MATFIVLGLVPGTQFQVTFMLWLLAISGIIAWRLLRVAWRSANLRLSLAAMALLWRNRTVRG